MTRVLSIDDDPVQQQLASVALRFAGFTPQSASNGQAGLDLLATERFDIILLDHDMPGLNGLQVLMELRKRKLLEDMPVIYVTSREEAAVIDRAFELGASGFVTKPVNWSLLPHQIRFTVRAAQNERAAAAARDAAIRLGATQSQLLSIVRHELRTPLGTVIGFGRLIRDGIASDHPLNEATQHMLAGAGLLQQRITEMMMCLDLESGRVHPRPERENAAGLVEEQLLKWKQPFLSKGLEPDFESTATNAFINVDASHLSGILDRLFNNVIEHGRGAKTVHVRIADAADGLLAISIADDGIGIAPERLEDCRKAFQQASTDQARTGEGLGLGLHIVDKLAELNGMRFLLASPGIGGGVQAKLLIPVT